MRAGQGQRGAGRAGLGRGTHHSVQEVEGPQADGLVLVVQTLQDQVLVSLHGLGMCSQDLGHGQQAQVLHCGDGEMQLTWTRPHRLRGLHRKSEAGSAARARPPRRGQNRPHAGPRGPKRHAGCRVPQSAPDRPKRTSL